MVIILILKHRTLYIFFGDYGTMSEKASGGETERFVFCCIVGPQGPCERPGRTDTTHCSGCLRLVRAQPGAEQRYWIWVERCSVAVESEEPNKRPAPYFRLEDCSDGFYMSTA